MNNDLTQEEIKRITTPKHPWRWGREKELELAQMVLEGKTLPQLAEAFNRSQTAIDQKINKTGFLCLTKDEADFYQVTLSLGFGRGIPTRNCPPKAQDMRLRYPD